jgi:hypothetical protein
LRNSSHGLYWLAFTVHASVFHHFHTRKRANRRMGSKDGATEGKRDKKRPLQSEFERPF